MVISRFGERDQYGSGVARSENYNEGDHDGDGSDCFALVFRIESPFIGSLCA